MGKWLVPLSALIVLGLNFIWLPFLAVNWSIHPFPFNQKQGISITAYVDFIGRILSYVYISLVLWYHSPKFREYFFIIAAGWFLYLIDFFLTYNDPWRFYHGFPVSYSVYMAACLIAWTWYEILNKK